MTESRITNNVATARRQHGLSVADLARAAGVTRQTVYAIENGSFVPNTAVALRLAMLLHSSVETLFQLQAPGEQTKQITFLPDVQEIQPGQPLKLCKVGDRTVALSPSASPSFLPSCDAVLVGKGTARLLNAEALTENRLLVAGCDPALSIVARYAHKANVNLVLIHRNSSEALRLVKDGLIHIAGTHLFEKTNPIPRSLTVVSFAVWEQGLASRSIDMKDLTSLTRRGVRFANREQGSGARALLDRKLGSLGIENRRIRGYENVSPGHLAAAWQVKTGAADCCIAARSAATYFGLHFTPLVSERYDFVVHRSTLKLPLVQSFFQVLTQSGCRRELHDFGGHDIS